MNGRLHRFFVSQLLSDFRFHEFYVKAECGVGRDVPCSFVPVAVFLRDDYLHVIALAHACQGDLPSWNQVFNNEAGWQGSVVGAVEDASVNQFA